MTQTRFNIVQIILIIIIIVGTILLSKNIWKCFNEKHRTVSIVCIGILLVIGTCVSILYGFGLVLEEKSITGTVTSVTDKALPVFMGPDRAYTIYIEEETEPIWGEVVYSFTTDAFSGRELKKIASQVKPGDRVLLKYNRWHDLYYCEILNAYE